MNGTIHDMIHGRRTLAEGSEEALEVIEEFKPDLDLSNVDGNAFGILACASKAIRRTGAPKDYVDQFLAEAKAGNYEHLLATVERYCDVDIY